MLTMETEDTGIVVIRASGKLSRADYDRFVPEFEQIAKASGPMRLLIELDDFRGWDLPGLWEELKFAPERHGPGRDHRRQGLAGMGHAALETLLQGRDALFRPRSGSGRPGLADRTLSCEAAPICVAIRLAETLPPIPTSEKSLPTVPDD